MKTIVTGRKDTGEQIAEIKGSLSAMVLEREKLQFEIIKYDLDSVSSANGPDKEIILKQLTARKEEAREATGRLRQ